MTEKRFDCVLNEFDEIEYISDIVDCEDRDFPDFLDYVNKMSKENEQLRKSVRRQQKSNDECSKYIEQVVKEYELLQEECLDIVNIITDARIEIFESQSYKGYDILGDAIYKLQKIAYKEIY